MIFLYANYFQTQFELYEDSKQDNENRKQMHTHDNKTIHISNRI